MKCRPNRLAVTIMATVCGWLLASCAHASVLVPQTEQWDALSAGGMSSSQTPKDDGDHSDNDSEHLRIPLPGSFSSNSQGSAGAGIAYGGVSAVVVQSVDLTDETSASLFSAESLVVVEGPGDRLFRPPRSKNNR